MTTFHPFEAMQDFSRQEPPECITPTSQSIDWYHEGESRTVEVSGIKVTVRFIGRKGRRGRIAITAPAGATFRGVDAAESLRSSESSA
jgi:hypothetical protein